MWIETIFIALSALLRLTLTHEVEFYPAQSSNVLSKSIKPYLKRPLLRNPSDLELNEKCLDKNSLLYARYSSQIEINNMENKTAMATKKRAVDPKFHGYPKTREELWHEHFLKETKSFDQTSSLIALINNITLRYLNDCIPVIFYDSQIKLKERYLFENLLKRFPVSYIHGFVDDDYRLKEPKILHSPKDCLNFIIFLEDIKATSKVLGKQSRNKVVVVARSSQWAVQEFLSSSLSRIFVNLLVIGQTFTEDDALEAPYILYTHKLYTDGLGASKPHVLTSWIHGKFSRDMDLFPSKMTEGYSGHRFLVAAANQPPFVFRRIKTDPDGGNPRIVWDGIEIRLLNLLAERNNFSIEVSEPPLLQMGAGDAVTAEVALGRADIGVAGMYLTKERLIDMDMSYAHSQDCAAFITLASTALPRYRAILGPFHWHVWVALTFTYLIAIFPLAFSDKHTLRHLLNNSGEIENMFWYVFGTFTNCFTFVGKNSWSKTTKITTRLLIGWYWLFTIIITSCYTGSIIAFVTLPIFPETVDSIQQLLRGFYRVGTLDRGGWERWFFNSSDPNTNKLLKKMEFVPNVQSGIRNTTKAFFLSYAFLGSQAELEYIVQSNFTLTKSKRSLLHISNQCFVPFGVGIGFPNNSIYTGKLSGDIQRILQSGILDKIVDEVRWEMQRSSSGKLLSVGKGSLKLSSVEEKGLTLEDTQGMFLLLGVGFLLAATSLVSEWMGGFTKYCRKKIRKISDSNSREDLVTTPKSQGSLDEFKIASDEPDSRLRFRAKSSNGSECKLGGKVINVTEDDILIHHDYHVHDVNSRRSSSVDLDREVREIFQKDEKSRKLGMEAIVMEDVEDHRNETASKIFGSLVQMLVLGSWSFVMYMSMPPATQKGIGIPFATVTNLHFQVQRTYERVKV